MESAEHGQAAGAEEHEVQLARLPGRGPGSRSITPRALANGTEQQEQAGPDAEQQRAVEPDVAPAHAVGDQRHEQQHRHDHEDAHADEQRLLENVGRTPAWA